MTDEEIKEYWRTAYCNEKYKKEELEKKNTDLEWQLQEVVKDNDNYQAENKRLEQENRLLGERCNQLLKDKGELTDQIADIKANCDLAIEGRDVKIMELEQQIEKMNCCGNCKGVCNSDDVAYFCKNNGYKLWEIK